MDYPKEGKTYTAGNGDVNQYTNGKWKKIGGPRRSPVRVNGREEWLTDTEAAKHHLKKAKTYALGTSVYKELTTTAPKEEQAQKGNWFVWWIKLPFEKLRKRGKVE